jgi:hypothetical protein
MRLATEDARPIEDDAPAAELAPDGRIRAVRLADAFPADDAALLVISDRDFVVCCTCGLEQRLDTMPLDEDEDLTLYGCARCENSLLPARPNFFAALRYL